MISVHKLKGEEIWVNPELIAFIDDGGHQSLITLLDGRHIVVNEKPDAIAHSIREHRARILSLAFRMEDPEIASASHSEADAEPRHLHPVPAPES